MNTNAANATPEFSHAEVNAIAWFETIKEYAACLDADRDRLEELRDERTTWVDNEGGDDDEQNRTPEEWAKEFPDDAAELAELEIAVTVNGEELDADECRERIEESPLSVEVRGGWRSPGAMDDGPEEYCILLSTGGPALRIVGDLSMHAEPTSARLEYQDWGTPWTERITTGKDHDALMRFVSVFYFGG
jgi:hypothetical protein